MLVNTICVTHDDTSAPLDPICSLAEHKIPERRLGPTLNIIFSHLSHGTLLSDTGDKTPVKILRDFDSSQTFARVGSLLAAVKGTGKHVVLSSITGRSLVPLFDMHLDISFHSSPALAASIPELPVTGVDLVLGNDLVGERGGDTPPFSRPYYGP